MTDIFTHCVSAWTFLSLIAEIAKSAAEYFKYLSNTEKNGDHSESVHSTEEDGFFKVFRYHALSHIEGLLQGAGVTDVHRVNLRTAERDEGTLGLVYSTRTCSSFRHKLQKLSQAAAFCLKRSNFLHQLYKTSHTSSCIEHWAKSFQKWKQTWKPKRWLCSQKAMISRMMRSRTEIM